MPVCVRSFTYILLLGTFFYLLKCFLNEHDFPDFLTHKFQLGPIFGWHLSMASDPDSDRSEVSATDAKRVYGNTFRFGEIRK